MIKPTKPFGTCWISGHQELFKAVNFVLCTVVCISFLLCLVLFFNSAALWQRIITNYNVFNFFLTLFITYFLIIWSGNCFFTCFSETNMLSKFFICGKWWWRFIVWLSVWLGLLGPVFSHYHHPSLADHQIIWAASGTALLVLIVEDWWYQAQQGLRCATWNILDVLNRSCLECLVHSFTFAILFFICLPQLPQSPGVQFWIKCHAGQHGRTRPICASSLLWAGFPGDPQGWLLHFLQSRS